jgi:signal transduction histidine kinase
MKDLSACTVLIVDDTELNVDLLVDCLGDQYELIVAMDGPSALDAVAESAPDLILLDIMMPGMDGYEVCRHLKSREETREIPVIFITAMGEVKNEMQGLALGAVDYITKPINPPIVRARVRNHLELKLAREAIQRQNAELKKNYENLSELERLRDSLTHMIVHDMRSPLMAIQGGVELIKMDVGETLGQETADDLQMTLDSTRRLIEMVNTLLDVSKMEAGSMPLERQLCDLRTVTQQAMDSLAPMTRHCQVILDAPENPVNAHCDPDIVRRIMINLLGNAVAHTPANGEIRIRLLPNAHWTRMEVSDTGPGIPPEYQELIFEKFGQVKTDSTIRQYSTGLGLTFCKAACEAHGGQIGVVSKVGRGSTFWFTLPQSRTCRG